MDVQPPFDHCHGIGLPSDFWACSHERARHSQGDICTTSTPC
jgi:hypothetical protein